MSEEINVAEKKAELMSMWQTLLKIVSSTIADIESGKGKLSASMIKELSGFLRVSGEILTELEKFNREAELKQHYEAALSVDDGMEAPFPVDLNASVTEPLDV